MLRRVLKFDERSGTSTLVRLVAGGLLVGAVSCWLVLQGLARFSSLLISEAVAPAVGVGGVAFLLVMLAGLRGTRSVQIEGDVLCLTPWVGLPREYPLATSTFSPHLSYHRGRVTQRSLAIESRDGSRVLAPLTLQPHRFDELVRLLRDGGPGGAAPWLTGRPQEEQPAAAARDTAPGPLTFPPRTFVTRRAGALVPAWILIALGLLILVGFVFLAAQSPVESAFAGILGFGLLMAGLVGGVGLLRLRSAARIPRAVVVAPESVTFGTRTFRYADLYVMELPAPGLPPVRAKLQLRTTAGVDHTVMLAATSAQFPDYAAFATLLREAANAVKPVVNFRYSG